MTFVLSILMAALLGRGQTADAQAADFFPLTPGFKTSYSDSALDKGVLFNQVQPAIMIEATEVVPVSSYRDGMMLDSVYYRASGDQVFIEAYDAKHLLKKPRLFFKIGPGREEWTYKGETPSQKSDVPIELKGESRPGGKKRVLGAMVDTLLVKLDAMIGFGTSAIQDHQEIELAKGIGLVEMTETVTINGKSQSHVLTLIKFEPDGGKS